MIHFTCILVIMLRACCQWCLKLSKHAAGSHSLGGDKLGPLPLKDTLMGLFRSQFISKTDKKPAK